MLSIADKIIKQKHMPAAVAATVKTFLDDIGKLLTKYLGPSYEVTLILKNLYIIEY